VILVATVPQAAERLSRVFGGAVLTVETFEEAALALSQERFSLVIVGVYFADSRMFELLSFARGSLANRATPIVCVLGIRGDLAPGLIRSVANTVNSMEGCVFYNLAAVPDDEAGNAEVRAFVETFLVSAALAAHSAGQPPRPATPAPQK
jgi:hypothetical protein